MPGISSSCENHGKMPALPLDPPGFSHGEVQACVVALITLIFADSVGFHGTKRWYAIAFPVTALLFVYILLRTASLNLFHGGITWRGTFYRLKELRANKVYPPLFFSSLRVIAK